MGEPMCLSQCDIFQLSGYQISLLARALSVEQDHNYDAQSYFSQCDKGEKIITEHKMYI